MYNLYFRSNLWSLFNITWA